MLIGKNYKIESDDLNVTLFEKHIITGNGKGRPATKPIGSEYWEPIAHFFTVKAALDYFVRQEIRNTGLTDLKTIVDKIEEIHKLIQTFDETHLREITTIITEGN